MKTLAHPSQDSEEFVRRASAQLAWSGAEFILPLEGLSRLVETMESVRDVEGVVRIGHPGSPDLELLSTLYAARTPLLVSRVAKVSVEWVLVRATGQITELRSFIMREQTYLDLLPRLSTDGIRCEVVPNKATAQEMAAQAGSVSAAMVGIDELRHVPELKVTPYGHQSETTVGLLTRDASDDPDHFWLALTPRRERPGTLARALDVIAELNVDLSFVHSDPLSPSRHTFYLGYVQSEPRLTERVAQRLTADDFEVKLLGAFSGESS